MSEDEKVLLTTEQALSMLPEGENIHTFRNPGGIMLGCDWEREAIESAIRDNQCEVGGELCCGMGHGLIVWVDNSPLFVECKEGTDYKSFEPVQSQPPHQPQQRQ